MQFARDTGPDRMPMCSWRYSERTTPAGNKCSGQARTETSSNKVRSGVDSANFIFVVAGQRDDFVVVIPKRLGPLTKIVIGHDGTLPLPFFFSLKLWTRQGLVFLLGPGASLCHCTKLFLTRPTGQGHHHPAARPGNWKCIRENSFPCEQSRSSL